MIRQLVLAAGFLLGAYLPVFLFLATAAVSGSGVNLRDLVEAAAQALALYPLSLIVALFIGFPTYVLLSRIKRVSLATVSLSGFCAGVLGGILLGVPIEMRAFIGHLGSGLLGLTGALTFWSFLVLSQRFERIDQNH